MQLTATWARRFGKSDDEAKRVRFRGPVLALLVALLLSTFPAGAAEIVSLTFANLTTGAWGNAIAPEPDVGALITDYTDANGC